MLAYLASYMTNTTPRSGELLATFAKSHDLTGVNLIRLDLDGFQLNYFDTGHELSIFQDDRHLMLLSGALLNKRQIRHDTGSTSEGDAELMLSLYKLGTNALAKSDGHLSFLLFDAAEKRLTLVADRFHRYSIVYSVSDGIYASSHSFLLYPLLSTRALDNDGLSQSIHYRWLTGTKKLFAGIQQVLPGSVLHIDRSGRSHRVKYFQIGFRRKNSGAQTHWTREVDTALERSLARVAEKHDVIGVPLSGGVDSSLLLAKAKGIFKKCVAVSVRFQNGENPELESARYFATKLGVRHVITDLDNDFVRDFFPKLIRIHEQPPRNYSDIALARTLEVLRSESDAFLYGEAADTYFGSHNVHRSLDACKKTLPIRIMPMGIRKIVAAQLPRRDRRSRLLRSLLGEGLDDFLRSLNAIFYGTPASDVFNCAAMPTPDEDLEEFLSIRQLPLRDRLSIQNISTDVMNHIENAGRLATFFGLQMYVPFVLNDVRTISEQLPFKLQARKGSYKAVLRKLSCQYFDPAYVYAKKHGFPTPTENWMNGPLSQRVTESRMGKGAGSRYYSAEGLSSLSIDTGLPHYWYTICLDELLSQAEALVDCHYAP